MKETSGKSRLEEIFGADLRSLAALRIGTALLVIVDLVLRATDLTAHYTDWGILPRAVLLEKATNVSPLFSIHLISGSWQGQAVLFLLAGLFAAALLLGYRTRGATIASWFFLISLQTRNPLILQASDSLLRMILFWGMFLPWGARYSLDCATHSPQKLPKRVLSLGTFAYFMQVALVYGFTALLKSGPEWRTEGSAIYYALSIDQFATPLGHFLLQFPALLKFLTHAVFGLEAVGPFLLFSPVFTAPLRTVTVFAFCLMQLGIGFNMELGLFPWVSVVALLGFLPSWVWDKGGAS